ncbi:hypothetical protein [Elizabethkingia miricola]|uniref:hypothetical protein n=1 Tax=Elizabethkingia miricola TaxID=172045 RepID=UPI003891F2D6
MKKPKTILKSLFNVGKKPKSEDFSDWMDSYHHKDEAILMENISGLKSALDDKLERSAESTLIGAFQELVDEAKDVVNKAYLGMATPASTAPPIGSFYYKVADENITTFPNLKEASGTPVSTIADDFEKDGAFYDVTIEVKDGVAKKERSQKQSGRTPKWSNVNPYKTGAQVSYNDFIWEAASVTTGADVPGQSPKWLKTVGKSLDTPDGVLGYDKASLVLGTYIDIASEDINYLPLDYYALKHDNTRVADYPYTCSVMDIDVEHFDQLRYFACKSGGDPLLYCSALGIKANGEKVVLLNAIGADTSTPTDIILDVKDFKSASLSWQNKQTVTPVFTKKRLNGGNTLQGDISEIKSKIKDIKPNSKSISTDNFQLGALRNDNVYEADTAQKTILNVSTEGYTELLFNGFPSTVGASNVNKYATIVGIKSTGEVNVLEKAAATTNTEMLNKRYDVSKYPSVSFSWGNYGASAGSTPIIELSGISTFNENTERIINLNENSYRDLEALTETITLTVKSAGSFGNMNVFRFTGGGILFSGEISMDKNSDTYDPSKVNTVYAYSEYGIVKCLIEN